MCSTDNKKLLIVYDPVICEHLVRGCFCFSNNHCNSRYYLSVNLVPYDFKIVSI